MSQTVLPNSINYNEQLPSLSPNVQNFTQVLAPVNGSVFSQNSSIIFDLPSRGFIDPQSIYIRYKMTVGVTADVAAGAFNIPGCPVFTPFSRVDTYINSQMIETIQDYNVVAHSWSNLFLGVNEKYGNQYGFGYVSSDVTGLMSNVDGRFLPIIAAISVPVANQYSYTVSAPLVCTKLTSCEKMIPAFCTGGIRIILTIDSWLNILSSIASLSLANTNISQMELVYDMIDFGQEVENSILSQPSIMIKTNGYANSSVTIPIGTTGTNTLVYNQRFASIRSAIVMGAGVTGGARTVNGKFDSVDVTNGGFYSLNVGGVQFPQGGAISFTNNKAGAMSELRKATGNLYDWSKSMSINSIEFGLTEIDTTTLISPGKCYVGFDLNKINSSSKNMLNGTSSQNSPINLTLNIVTAISNAAKNVYLLLNYDCVFIIDPRTKMITMNQ